MTRINIILKTLVTVLCVISLVSCSEGTEEKTLVAARFSAADTDWKSGPSENSGSMANLGISLDGSDKYLNLKYVKLPSSDKYTGNPLMVALQQPESFKAYGPFSGIEGKENGVIEFTVTGEKMTDYVFGESSWDGKGYPDISLSLGHSMSLVTLQYSSESGKLKGVLDLREEGLLLSGSFDPSTGEAAASAKGETILDMKADMEKSSQIIIPPQSGTGVKLLMSIDNKQYTGELAMPALIQGTAYAYKVTVPDVSQSDELSIELLGIGPWEGSDINVVPEKIYGKLDPALGNPPAWTGDTLVINPNGK